MAFSDLKTSALSLQFSTDYFADTVTYNGSEIPAVVDYMENPDEPPGTQHDRCEILVRSSDVASPAYRDTVVINSVTWRVFKPKSSGDNEVHVIQLYRDERPHL